MSDIAVLVNSQYIIKGTKYKKKSVKFLNEERNPEIENN
jgi:hypothetical protein